MRKFSSYGPVSKKLHYYVPRTELVEKAVRELTGGASGEGGRYITVWAPRQCGKTWIVHEAAGEIRRRGDFEVGILSMQSARTETTDEGVLELFAEKLGECFDRDFETPSAWKHLSRLFSGKYFDRPVILVIDEFDSLREDFIEKFANEFRDMYITGRTDVGGTVSRRSGSPHGLALVGVRAVLGIENVSGSPFNVQRSMRIPNLTFEETTVMFRWYEKESGQRVDSAVIDGVHRETRGQPGLVSWFGELLTEGYEWHEPDTKRPIEPEDFGRVLSDAVNALPNNNILNIVDKARRNPYRQMVLELFKTRETVPFRFDDPSLNFLYTNGVIDWEKAGGTEHAAIFSCPFVQKRLFNYFSGEIFQTMDHLYDPMTDIKAVAGENELNIEKLMELYRTYLHRNREWLLKDAPRRKTDLRIFEAVFHFNLYMFLKSFLRDKGGEVFPEFPTGNGKIDILIRYGKKLYALELKSFKDRHAYGKSLAQASEYASRLGLKEIFLILFVETMDDENRRRLERVFIDECTGIEVRPVFVETGNAPQRRQSV